MGQRTCPSVPEVMILPRVARKKSCSGVYHIMLRGINRQTIFEEDADKRKFLGTLEKFKEVSHFELYAYCLMDNHIHLLIKESTENISMVIKRISSSYVYWYNLKYERSGHLFQDRFRSESVEDTRSFVTVLRYIHQNPLKAHLVKSVFDHQWTSIHEYMHNASLVDVDRALHLFSPDRRIAMQSFIGFIQESNEDQCLDDFKAFVRLPDSEVMEYLHLLGIHNNSSLQQMDRKERNLILSRLKNLNGTTIRQISRITGISKSVIDRIQ